MKRAITLSIAAFALAGTAFPTFAADLARPLPAGPVGAPYNWTGIYIGGNVGAKWGEYTPNVAFGPSTDGGATTAGFNFLFGTNSSTSNASFLGGGQIGFNYQVDAWVLGIEGDFDATHVRQTFIVPPTVFFPFTAGDALSFNNNWQASVRGRYGYAWDRWMFYVTGGVAFANVQATTNLLPVGTAAAFAGTATTTGVGYTVGAGFEWGIWDNLSLGLEYRFTAFGTRDLKYAFGNAFVAPGVTSPLTAAADLDTHEVTARLNYRFNWGAPVAARY